MTIQLNAHKSYRLLYVGYGSAKGLENFIWTTKDILRTIGPSELFLSSTRRFPASPERFGVVSRASDTEIFFHYRPISGSIYFPDLGFDFARFLLRASHPLPTEIFPSNSVPHTLSEDKMLLLM
jgi:hypothetical protein